MCIMYTMIDWPAMCTQSWFDMYICLKKQRVHLLQIFTLITPWSLWPFSSVQLSKGGLCVKLWSIRCGDGDDFFWRCPMWRCYCGWTLTLAVSHVKAPWWMNFLILTVWFTVGDESSTLLLPSTVFPPSSSS